ncbi:MAG: type VI secretion system tip protein TssI/VgrG [Polyangiaceae bacterium]
MSHNQSVTIASKDVLDVRQYHVHEALSSLFEVTITGVSDNPDIHFDSVVGKEASFTLHGPMKGVHLSRTWTGIAAELQQTRVEPSGLSTYELKIVPALWLTTHRRNHRVYQTKTELQIVEAILAEWQIPYEKKISMEYKTRKFRVQYAESDFAFLSRLLEDAGITFYFEEREGQSVLVLADAPQSNDARLPPIMFRDDPNRADHEHVTSVRIGRRVRPGKYTMRDVDYRRPPTYPLVSSATNGEGVEQKLERFHFTPGAFVFETDRGEETPVADDRGKHRTDEGEARKLAEKRLAAKRGDALTASFNTNVIDLAPGSVMSVLDHPHGALAEDKRHLVIDARIDGGHNKELVCAVEVRSAADPFHPEVRTPKPKTQGMETATVVGPAGEEIHVDEFGRIRVQFHWDREGARDENSSCWIPVSQPWGGAGYGGSNLPRIGQEVLVDFLGGDPDRPMIVGRVYTTVQQTPYKLPQHKTRSTWKSDTSPGSNGFNEVMFEDKKGEELVWQQAQKNQRRLVKNDEVITIGNDRAKLVKANETETTMQNRTRVTNQNHTEITDQNNAVKVGANMTKLISGDEIRKTEGNRQRAVEKDEDANIGQSRREAIGQDSHSTVGGLLSQLIGAARSLIVKGDDQKQVAGKNAVEAGQEIHLKSGQLFVLEAGARLSIKGPAGFIDFHGGGIDIVGDLVRINSGGSPADGSGSKPTPPAEAAKAAPPDPPKPTMDDVSKTLIGQ